jgi:hypothetical protein
MAIPNNRGQALFRHSDCFVTLQIIPATVGVRGISIAVYTRLRNPGSRFVLQLLFQNVLRKEKLMGEQQSQKRGLRSEAQKEDEARDAYEPLPPANPVGGAFGEHKRDTPTDEDVSLAADTKRQQRDRKEQNA